MSTQVSIDVSTSSKVLDLNNLHPGTPPSIKISGLAVVAPPAPVDPAGFQLVVLDITKSIPSPASIVVNVYSTMRFQGGWYQYYHDPYINMVHRLLGAGNPDTQLVIIASFGLCSSMIPTDSFWGMLNNYGAGDQLRNWILAANSMGGSVIGPPANYIFVSLGNEGYGNGNEKYEQAVGGAQNINTTLSVSLSLP